MKCEPVSGRSNRVSIEAGALYVVATPIGNREDITRRARAVLQGVDGILAEDTRHSAGLLRHLGISARLIAFHEYNEARETPKVVSRLARGESLALISDAGTPLISDPGYHLINAVRARGLPVIPIPGASAFLCALSVAGLPTDRFVFEGFLPAKAAARQARLAGLSGELRTMVFYEAPHRIGAAVKDMAVAFGSDRHGAIARELTKAFEAIRTDTLQELERWLHESPHHTKGEFVVLVHGAEPDESPASDESLVHILRVLMEELPLKQAVALAARLTGRRRNAVYRMAVEIIGEDSQRKA